MPSRSHFFHRADWSLQNLLMMGLVQRSSSEIVEPSSASGSGLYVVGGSVLSVPSLLVPLVGRPFG